METLHRIVDELMRFAKVNESDEGVWIFFLILICICIAVFWIVVVLLCLLYKVLFCFLPTSIKEWITSEYCEDCHKLVTAKEVKIVEEDITSAAWWGAIDPLYRSKSVCPGCAARCVENGGRLVFDEQGHYLLNDD